MAKISLIIIFIIIIHVLFQLNLCFCQVNNDSNKSAVSPKDSLETEKLQLEIQKIKQDVESQNKDSLRQNGTLFAALLAAIIAFWSAWTSRKSQIESLNAQVEQYQKERISALLRDLGNDKVAIRLGAIQALSNMSDDNIDIVVSFLINLLKVDSEPRIIEAISTALLNMPSQSLSHLLDASKSLGKRRIRLAIDLVLLKRDLKNVAEIFSVKSKTVEKWMQDHQVNQRKEILKLDGGTEESVIADKAEKIIKEYRSLYFESNTIVEITGKIIRKLSTYDEHFSLKGAYLPGIILNNVELSFFDFSEADLMHADFENSILKTINFSGCDLSDSSFRDAIISESHFDKSNLNKTDLSRSKIIKTSFNDSKGEDTSFDGSNLNNDTFDRVHLFKAGFKGAKLDNISFEESTLYNSVFSGAAINNLSFNKADLGSTNLSSLKSMENVKFIETSFASTLMDRSNFGGACFIRSSFRNISNFDSSNFFGSHWDEPKFKKGTESFRAYLIKNNIIQANMALERA
jgi:uncharacterized protein YjbI with pentapeptide repeats